MRNDTIRRVAEILRLMDEARYGPGDSEDELRRAVEQAALLTGDMDEGSDPLTPNHYHYDYHAGLKRLITDSYDYAHVFVYGTLKRGFGNNRILKDGGADFVGEGRVQGYGLVDGGIPYAIRRDDTYTDGELFRVLDQHTMDRLDRLEGYPNHYSRDFVKVEIEGRMVGAWIYVYDTPERYADAPVVHRWDGGHMRMMEGYYAESGS